VRVELLAVSTSWPLEKLPVKKKRCCSSGSLSRAQF